MVDNMAHHRDLHIVYGHPSAMGVFGMGMRAPFLTGKGLSKPWGAMG